MHLPPRTQTSSQCYVSFTECPLLQTPPGSGLSPRALPCAAAPRPLRPRQQQRRAASPQTAGAAGGRGGGSWPRRRRTPPAGRPHPRGACAATRAPERLKLMRAARRTDAHQRLRSPRRILHLPRMRLHGGGAALRRPRQTGKSEGCDAALQCLHARQGKQLHAAPARRATAAPQRRSATDAAHEQRGRAACTGGPLPSRC